METETHAEARPAPVLEPSRDYPGQLDLTVWSNESNSTKVRLTVAELGRLVQQAGDQHGLYAVPF